MITRTDVFGDNDSDLETKINIAEREGWAVRQIVVLPATTQKADYDADLLYHRSNIIVVFERDQVGEPG